MPKEMVASLYSANVEKFQILGSHMQQTLNT